MKLPYDLKSKDSIIEFAKLLIGKTVNQEYKNEIENLEINLKDKGRLGKVIESLYFKYKNNSDAAADFKEAGLELKSSGLKKLAKDKGYNAKERLVLNLINFEKIVEEDFDELFLKGKNAHLLLVFYLYVKGINILNSEIKIVGDWCFSNEDIEVIKKDFEFIKNKILNGKAHELSEGDTFYLGACTKGANSKSTRVQPFSEIKAKQRAFSLKQGYLNHIIASLTLDNEVNYGKLIPNIQVAKKQTIEEIVYSKFEPLIGKSDYELIKLFSIEKVNPKVKNFHSKLSKQIVNSIFNVPKNNKIEDFIEEFKKASISVKTVRLKQNNLPKEDISFPTFFYEEIIDEEWEDSEFKNLLEQKFLFVFFKYDNESLILDKVKFWNMPLKDVDNAKLVWLKTKEIIKNGNIVKEIKKNKAGKNIRYTNFPNKKFNAISHVRPHAKDSLDTYNLPKRDKLTKLKEYTKHCFWLNNTYVKNEIYLNE